MAVVAGLRLVDCGLRDCGNDAKSWIYSDERGGLQHKWNNNSMQMSGK